MVWLAFDGPGISREFGKTAGERFGDFGVDQEAAVYHLVVENAAAGVNEGKAAAIGSGDLEAQTHEGVNRHRFIDALQEFLQSFASVRGSENLVRPVTVGLLHGRDFIFAQTINLVQDLDPGAILNAKVGQHLQNFGILLGVMRVGNVSDVQN